LTPPSPRAYGIDSGTGSRGCLPTAEQLWPSRTEAERGYIDLADEEEAGGVAERGNPGTAGAKYDEVPAQATILVVDDEEQVRTLVSWQLEADGFTVEEAKDGAAALDQIDRAAPDLVILDLTLPALGGLQVLSRIRQLGNLPIIVLAARRDEIGRIIALDLGADDYVVKPFSPRELAARVRSVLRRSGGRSRTRVLEFPGLRIDLDARQVTLDGATAELTAKEFELLAFLAASPRHTFSRARLLIEVWGGNPEWQVDATVTEHIRRLRQKLERDPSDPRWLRTVRHAGYQFDPSPESAAEETPEPGSTAVDRLLRLHVRVLEQLTAGVPLPEVLDIIAAQIDTLVPNTRCVILLVDEEAGMLRAASAPNVAPEWVPWINNLPVGPMSGSCGSAVHYRRRVIVENIADSPLFTGQFREAALAEGIRASWSLPFLSADGAVAGTFALYYPTPHAPSPAELTILQDCSNLVAMAVEHTRARAQLVASEQRFRQAFDANIVGMALLDTAGTLQQANPALCDMLGRHQRELVGCRLTGLVADDDRPGVIASLTHLGAARPMEIHVRRRSGTFRASMSLSALTDAAGELTGLCLHLSDDTERHAAEQERQARREADVARRTAEDASHAKSWFLSGLAHELHTPMSVITGYTELLQTLDLSASRRDAAHQRIAGAAQHVIALLDDVLDLAKIESGAIPLALAAVPVDEVVTEVVALLEPLAAERDIVMSVAAGPAPAIAVSADRRRLTQVVLNVLSNAIKYNRPRGTVWLSTARDDDWLTLRVLDEGPGMRPEELERALEPFDRLGAEAGDVQGTGLGLPLAQSLATAMGGRLHLTAGNSGGTAVEIVLPLALID
jgi:PAS domain S-box-containing protein